MSVNHLLARTIRARSRAIPTATEEFISLLRDLNVTAPSGGPLSEVRGVFWIDVPVGAVETASLRIPRLGYTQSVDLLVEQVAGKQRRTTRDDRVVRWRKGEYRIDRIYEQDPVFLRARAPDRRLFALPDEIGEIREVRGYRGDGSAYGRRALPVCDARVLVNLSLSYAGGPFLDPFAGAGGVAVEAIDSGLDVCTVDIDPVVAPGLETLGAKHHVGSATDLPFENESIGAIGTEPPYHRDANSMISAALCEMTRVLMPGGRIAMLVADHQARELRAAASSIILELDAPIDRKGTRCQLLRWRRPES